MSIVLDIETCAKPESELQPMMPEFEASKVLKDPDKIKADIDKKRKEWIDEAALKADRASILVIGLFHGEDRKTEFLEGNESEIISKFWKLYVNTNCNIIGHNLKGFDIPFLVRRSWLLGVETPFDLFRGRYINDRFKDTMEVWACGTRDTISLDNLSKAFGLPGKNGKGSEFAGQYLLGGDFKKKALDYLRSDLILTYSVAQRMCLI